jgi:3-phenylpropionate/trans-cinnamate dioxygenase ferredoxin subunit
MTWHTVCKADELPEGKMAAYTAGEQRVVVYHLKDGFFATQAYCTHTFAPLGRGKIIDGCKVQCPFHRARFDIKSGAVIGWANFRRASRCSTWCWRKGAEDLSGRGQARRGQGEGGLNPARRPR